MEQENRIVLVVIAVALVSLSFAFWCGEDYGSRVEPTAAVLDLRTIGSACTITYTSQDDNGLDVWVWTRNKPAEGMCATMYLELYNSEVSPFHVCALSDGEKCTLAQFHLAPDAVKWVEQQPYTQGGAK